MPSDSNVQVPVRNREIHPIRRQIAGFVLSSRGPLEVVLVRTEEKS